MKKVQQLKIIVIVLCATLLYGCPTSISNVILKSNKVKIDDDLEGGWDITVIDEVKTNMEVRKKDDYWAYVEMTFRDVEKKTTETMKCDLTMHIIDGQKYACLSGWHEGKKFGDVYAIELKENTLKVFELALNSEDKDNLKNTPLKVSEPVFMSYLKYNKIEKGRATYFYKKYDIGD